ncbi:MAG: hypothetical protein EOO73_03090 [Myxococcales bacterium]|nr:MAG: hypothetical protein EOO73_03090 [Myxococcales bacterium]
MMRKKTGLKELSLVVLCGAALVSVACGDDDDTGGDGTSGSAGTAAAGSSSAGSKSTGGSAGSKSTGGSGGTSAGGTSAGTSAGGTSAGGTSAGTSGGGTAGSAMGGESGGGVPGEGGAAGEGGAPIVGEAGADAGGAGGEGGAPVVAMDVLKNLSFESPIPPATWAPSSGTKVFPEWTNTATPDGSSYVQWGDVTSGDVRLAHWSGAAAYVARTEQEVSPLANGTYAFSIHVKRDAPEKLDSYLYAKGFDPDAPDDDVRKDTEDVGNTAYVKVTLGPIVVESGKLIVGVYTDAAKDAWINFDDASLERLPD